MRRFLAAALFLLPSAIAVLLAVTAPGEAQYVSLPPPAALHADTPFSCDGYSSSTAAMTSGSNIVTDTSATFTAADVGKLASVNGAGTTQYIQSATVSAGGTGYAVGDTIVLSGGTGSAGTLVVRSLSGSAVATVAGYAGSLGSYTVVPSNAVAQASTSGGGTGATFTVTWSRDNLVSTIQGVTDSTHVTLAANASATVSSALWGYGSDYATQINTAVATGNLTRLPKGRCGIASSISIDSKQNITGNGTAGYADAPTELLWLGAVGGTILKADTGTLVDGVRAGPFNLLGLGAASYGARFRGLAHSTINLQARSVKDFAVSLEESADGLYDTFFNNFKLIAVVNHVSAKSAVGISLPVASISGGVHDVNGNHFNNVSVFCQDGNGIDLREGYINVFVLTQIYCSGNGWGIRFGGSNADAKLTARANNFYDLISQSNLLSEGGTYPARQNRILPLDKVAYATTATIGAATGTTPATLFITTTDGNQNVGTSYGYDSRSCGNPVGTATTANYVAMGCGGTVIPNYSGKVRFTVDGAIKNGTAGSGVLVTIYQGTGSAPANGDNIETAGTTRTQCGGFPGLVNTPSTTFTTPFSVTCEANGLTAGTTFWYDLGVKSVVSGTASAVNTRLSATELP